MLGVDLKEVAAFGDGENDLEMLTAVRVLLHERPCKSFFEPQRLIEDHI